MSAAINRVVPLEKLRWISFGHVEADECGAMNLLLDAAPNAEVIHGALACMLSLTDMCDRPPVVAPDDGVHDIGGHRLRFIPTPHVPHNWEAGLWFDETTSTLLAGDLLTHTGQCPALTESDCVAPALEAEEIFHATGLTTNLGPTLEQLAAAAADYAGDHARLVLLAATVPRSCGRWPTDTRRWRARHSRNSRRSLRSLGSMMKHG